MPKRTLRERAASHFLVKKTMDCSVLRTHAVHTSNYMLFTASLPCHRLSRDHLTGTIRITHFFSHFRLTKASNYFKTSLSAIGKVV